MTQASRESSYKEINQSHILQLYFLKLRSINRIAEILGSIINGFALSLKEEDKLLIPRIPLHKPKCIISNYLIALHNYLISRGGIRSNSATRISALYGSLVLSNEPLLEQLTLPGLNCYS